MFGDNLKKYRIRKGLSQNDVAGALFVTRQCVSKWERGVTQPDLQTLSQLSALLGVSVDDLLGGSPSASEKNHNVNFLVANILIAVFCLLAFLATWRYLPAKIPAHWTGGKIDRYGSRNEIFINCAATAVFLSVDIFVFFAVRRVGDGKIALVAHGAVALFLIAHMILIISLYSPFLTGVTSYASCLCSALIMCFSAAMHPKISRRNRWLGVRTADTLKSETVWNKTNALACYLFTACSLIIFAVNATFNFRLSCLCLISYVPLTAAVIIYSKITAKKTD